MRPFERLTQLLPAILLFGAASVAAAQVESSPVSGPPIPRIVAPFFEPVVTVSGDSVDRLRLAQLAGRAPLQGLLLRSTSSITDGPDSTVMRRPFAIVLPQVTSVTNSELPFGQNDGALWAGKGYSFRLLAGITASFGPVRIVAIPEFVSSTNYNFSIDPTDLRFSRPIPSTRSDFSSPSNYVPYSIDLPYRLGDSAVSKLYPGQSSITVSFGSFQVGAATENEWWGPAIRNPLIFSDNAPGFPHGFIRTGRPVATAIGQFEGRWVVGGLHESDYFDKDISNDVRSISALSVIWKHRPQSGLTLGLARSVFAPVDGYSGVPARAFDFLRGTGQPNARAVTDSTFTPGPDQIFSVFAHWALPVYGLETYIEWARAELPGSLRDLLLEPNNARGYTTGLQWARPIGDGRSTFRTQLEFTNVEQSGTYRFRPVGSFYTSRAVIQGYTNEGQMLGTGIGPGSSGQWFEADYLRDGFMFGANFGRTRFNNDAFFARSNPHRCFHDVTVYPGVRAGFVTRFFRLRADYSKLTRYNTFFQRTNGCEADASAVGDRSSHHLSVTLSTLGL
ncbi:MAG: capsule assembly Wzi family protein [Gemmatimonadales bacterium]